MSDEVKAFIVSLAKKASTCVSAIEAVQYSQAASNLVVVLKQLEKG